MGNNLLMSVRKHLLAYVIGSTGWVINAIYLGYEYLRYGTEFYKHLDEPLLEHIMIILAIPVFMLVGLLFKKQKVAEEELRESEEKYRSLVENSIEGVCISKGNRILFANKALLDIFGYESVEEFRKIPLLDHFTPEFRNIIKERFEGKKRKEPTFYRFDCKVLRKDGEIRDVEISASEVQMRGEKYIQSTFRDITERKKAEEKIKRDYEIQHTITSILQVSLEPISLKEMLNRILELILAIPWLSFQSKGCIHLVEDKKILSLTAYHSFSKAQINTCSKVDFGRCLCGRCADTRRIIFSGCVDEAHEIVYKDMPPHGHYCVPITSGEKLLGVLNIYVKEGHQRSLEEEEFLSAVANVLSGIIERKRSEEQLKEAFERLKELDKMKDDFLSTVSHELRTPLTSIIGSIDILLDECEGINQRKLLELALKEAVRLNDLIGDILDITKTESRLLRMTLKLTSLDKLVEEAVERVKVHAQKKSISIIKHIPKELPQVEVDKDQFKRAITNLLENAIKFNKENGTVAIEARAKGNFVEISVIDTGIGIPEKHLPKIFDKFYRVETGTARKYKGTGLGLYIVKKIIDAHGGDIRVESKVNEGSKFTIRLPIKT